MNAAEKVEFTDFLSVAVNDNVLVIYAFTDRQLQLH